MILQKEIMTIATSKGVVKSTIDKDWALGHFIDAIFSVAELRGNLIFKGGTRLKKCYLPDYRFSEDLDFTSTNSGFRLTQSHLEEVCRLLIERAGMMAFTVSLRDLIFKNRTAGFEAIIKFWGADHPRGETPPPPERWQTKVKIEITLFEIVIFTAQKRDVLHQYSDSLTENAREIPCYAIEEVLSEKMRSLIQRSYSAPRDLYDLWYLSNHFPGIDYTQIVEAFHRKMAFKGFAFAGIQQLINPENDKQLANAWKNSLTHQVPGELPEYETVKTQLLNLFERIFNN